MCRFALCSEYAGIGRVIIEQAEMVRLAAGFIAFVLCPRLDRIQFYLRCSTLKVSLTNTAGLLLL